MLIYEVNLEVNRPIFEDYIRWLQPHIKELLTFDGFLKADLLFDTNDEQADVRKITIAYYLKDYQSYYNYINGPAVTMREQGSQRFKGQFVAHRRLLELQRSYLPNELLY
ncbi:Uncharacterised protein [Legionella lansingensis]|uniref:DUF4286 domain-containing protein n=1 Tax=Legionella lansingensis TaxID=45067 RepID=A0A0W0VFE7_9GAMM|nr:DUF4286 family protein [Legionella lansingensis]KTD18840.1 hypothetical protein Llan_2443 [Legionella lansingensis]SNV52835.1 Uncharacterised protein [Legionella lansingensis]